MSRSVRRRLRDYILPYRWDFAAALLTIFLISGAELLKPWPFKIVIDNVLGAKPLPGGLALPSSVLVILSSLSIVVIYALSALLTFVGSYLQVELGRKIVSDLRSDLYGHLQRLSLRFHNSWPEGDLLYRVTTDTSAIQTFYTSGVLPLLSALVLAGGMFLVLIRLDLLLTCVALGIGPLLLLLLQPLGRKLSTAASGMKAAESQVLTSAQRSISSMQLIQAFTREPDEYTTFMEASHASLRAGVKYYLLQSLYGAAANIVIGIWVALLIGLGAYQVSSGRITVGGLVVFSSYLAVLLFSMHQATQSLASLKGARAGVQRVFGVLDQEIEIRDGMHYLQPQEASAPLVFREVCFAYVEGRPVLNHIDLRIEPGERVAIVGESGSGKSTLVSLISRFYDPDSGQILLGPHDLRHLRLRSLRQQVSMVLQPPVLFPMSIAENLRYGSPGATEEQILEVARMARIDPFIRGLPDGYETLIGERGVNLSEGQKQRLTIARAMLRDVPIVILDEPTSAMDTETEQEVMAGLQKLLEGKTSLIIAHRLSTIRNADRIIVMSNGSIVEQGTYQELLSREGVFAHLCCLQYGIDVAV